MRASKPVIRICGILWLQSLYYGERIFKKKFTQGNRLHENSLIFHKKCPNDIEFAIKKMYNEIGRKRKGEKNEAS